jgi:uncharacterized repeat protein (TIGR01451 family)
MVMLSLLPVGLSQALDLPEVYVVHFELRPGPADQMWGVVDPDVNVAVEKGGTTFLFEVTADSSGNWSNPFPLEVNPGDWFTVTAGAGLNPVDIQIPDPFVAEADSTTEQVWGQIDDLYLEDVVVQGNWDNIDHVIPTDEHGNFSYTYADIPNGGDGHVTYNTMVDYTDVYYHGYFRTLDLILEVNYAHDWIQGPYEPGHTVWLWLYEGDGFTLKATAQVGTAEIPWWGGNTGFSTDMESPWVPERPNIEPGDWVYGLVDNSYDAWVRVGTITGEVDTAADEVTGKVDVSWLPQDENVNLLCDPWDASEGTVPKEDTVKPDNTDVYTCSWSGEWDIQPLERIGVSYQDPGGYTYPGGGGSVDAGHRIYDVYVGYTDDLVMRIHYDHDWIEGYYEPGHTIALTVYDSGMSEKAQTTVSTGPIGEWEWLSGFATWLEDTVWVPDHPDIQPGDIIHGAVDGGSAFTADVKVGLITGTPNEAADSISGTVNADVNWPAIDLDPVDVACSIWEPEGREVHTTVVPNGADTYTCVFDGENVYDIIPGTNLMVSYFEPEGHRVFGDFSPPAPYLVIEKWFIGENPSVGSIATFVVRYRNQGTQAAENVLIEDAMVGMTYLSDTSGFPTTGSPGDTLLTWDLGTVEPGDWIWFEVLTDLTAPLHGYVNNIVEISTTTPFDKGEPWEKISTWEGTVVSNDIYLPLIVR